MSSEAKRVHQQKNGKPEYSNQRVKQLIGLVLFLLIAFFAVKQCRKPDIIPQLNSIDFTIEGRKESSVEIVDDWVSSNIQLVSIPPNYEVSWSILDADGNIINQSSENPFSLPLDRVGTYSVKIEGINDAGTSLHKEKKLVLKYSSALVKSKIEDCLQAASSINKIECLKNYIYDKIEITNNGESSFVSVETFIEQVENGAVSIVGIIVDEDGNISVDLESRSQTPGSTQLSTPRIVAPPSERNESAPLPPNSDTSNMSDTPNTSDTNVTTNTSDTNDTTNIIYVPALLPQNQLINQLNDRTKTNTSAKVQAILDVLDDSVAIYIEGSDGQRTLLPTDPKHYLEQILSQYDDNIEIDIKEYFYNNRTGKITQFIVADPEY